MYVVMDVVIDANNLNYLIFQRRKILMTIPDNHLSIRISIFQCETDFPGIE